MIKETIRGKAYVVGDAVDTDQIIPAEHLVLSLSDPDERRLYGRFAMSGVPVQVQGLPDGGIPFTGPDAYTSVFTIVVGGENFGCGSSREHAPFALQEAGCEAVVAQSYARIFYRNAVDGGFIIPFETSKRLIDFIKTGDELVIDTSTHTLTNITSGVSFKLNPLGDVAAILEAGDVFEYARRSGLMTR